MDEVSEEEAQTLAAQWVSKIKTKVLKDTNGRQTISCHKDTEACKQVVSDADRTELLCSTDPLKGSYESTYAARATSRSKTDLRRQDEHRNLEMGMKDVTLGNQFRNGSSQGPSQSQRPLNDKQQIWQHHQVDSSVKQHHVSSQQFSHLPGSHNITGDYFTHADPIQTRLNDGGLRPRSKSMPGNISYSPGAWACSCSPSHFCSYHSLETRQSVIHPSQQVNFNFEKAQSSSSSLAQHFQPTFHTVESKVSPVSFSAATHPAHRAASLVNGLSPTWYSSEANIVASSSLHHSFSSRSYEEELLEIWGLNGSQNLESLTQPGSLTHGQSGKQVINSTNKREHKRNRGTFLAHGVHGSHEAYQPDNVINSNQLFSYSPPGCPNLMYYPVRSSFNVGSPCKSLQMTNDSRPNPFPTTHIDLDGHRQSSSDRSDASNYAVNRSEKVKESTVKSNHFGKVCPACREVNSKCANWCIECGKAIVSVEIQRLSPTDKQESDRSSHFTTVNSELRTSSSTTATQNEDIDTLMPVRSTQKDMNKPSKTFSSLLNERNLESLSDSPRNRSQWQKSNIAWSPGDKYESHKARSLRNEKENCPNETKRQGENRCKNGMSESGGSFDDSALHDKEMGPRLKPFSRSSLARKPNNQKHQLSSSYSGEKKYVENKNTISRQRPRSASLVNTNTYSVSPHEGTPVMLSQHLQPHIQNPQSHYLYNASNGQITLAHSVHRSLSPVNTLSFDFENPQFETQKPDQQHSFNEMQFAKQFVQSGLRGQMESILGPPPVPGFISPAFYGTWMTYPITCSAGIGESFNTTQSSADAWRMYRKKKVFSPLVSPRAPRHAFVKKGRGKNRSKGKQRTAKDQVSKDSGGDIAESPKEKEKSVPVPPLKLDDVDSYDEILTLIRTSRGEALPYLCLPEELILYVFSYLTTSELATCARVCHQFHRIAMDESLWKEIVIRRKKLDDSLLNKIGIKRPVSLTITQCHSNKVTAEGLRNLFRSCGDSLEELDFSGCSGSALVGESILLHVSSRCRKLRSLDISWGNVSDVGLQAVADTAERLECLYLNGCQAITDEAIKYTAEKHKESLRVVEVFGCFNITSAILTSLSEHCPNMETLNMGQCHKVTDIAVRQIASKMEKLENLDLRGCKQIRDSAVKEIASNCLSLSTLVLANCLFVTDVSLVAIAKNLPKLRCLDICGCSKVTDKGVQALAKSCHRLEVIDLSSTKVTHKSVTSLANYSGQTLETVKLSFCHDITEASLQQLAKKCQRLKVLHLYGCKRLRNLTKVQDLNKGLKIEKECDVK